MREAGKTWNKLRRFAQDMDGWTEFVGVLCPGMRSEEDFWYVDFIFLSPFEKDLVGLDQVLSTQYLKNPLFESYQTWYSGFP